jgi:ketosteroid isomerase-like protein
MNTADVLAIQRLLADYADAVGTRDQAAWAATWTADCVWHLSGGRSSVGRDQTVELWVSAIARYPWVSQLVTNTIIDLDSADTAHGRCTILEFNRLADGSGAMHVGTYDDRYRKTGERWQFAERKLHLMYRGPLDPGTVIPLNTTEALPS